MAEKSFYQHDETSLAQASRVPDWTWEGASVFEWSGKIAELYTQIPFFSHRPFRAGTEENRYKDEIWREPMKITEHPTPVSTVSKTYALVQHRDLLAFVFQALRKRQIDISEVESTVLMSEYGERLHWSCPIPNMKHFVLHLSNPSQLLDLRKAHFGQFRFGDFPQQVPTN